MSKKFIFCLFVFIVVLSFTAFCEEPLGEIILKSGELSEFAIEASEGETDFSKITDYLKKLFLGELTDLKSIFLSLCWIVILSSVKDCFSLSESVSTAVRISINSACVLISSDFMASLFETAKNCISELGDFMLLSFPYLCSLMASSGKTLAAAKGALISLGSANILSYLTENVFMALTYLFYLMALSSSIIENDIFKSLKKAFLSVVKKGLPFFVGIYTAVLTLFLKTSAHSDEFMLKTTKTLLSSGIPFLGNVLNKSADTVLSSVKLIQSQAGIITTVSLIAVIAFPIVKLLCGMLLFKVLAIVSTFSGNEKMGALFNELGEAVALMAGMTGAMGVMAVISIVLLI